MSTTIRTQRTTDLYPSRTGTEARLIDRKDPVVHGEPTGTLTRYQRNLFEAKGFLALPGFFPMDEVHKLQEEAARLRKMDELRGEEDVITEPESDEIRSIFQIHKRSDVFDAVARDPRILNRVREILGGDVYIHQSRINYKPGMQGKDFFWHSDFETWHVEDGMPRMRAVSCSITLTPNYEFNGPLMMIPGSHHYFLSTVGETPEEHFKSSLKKQEIGVPDMEGLEKLIDLGGGIEVPKGPSGSVTMFECNVMHGSNSNITPYPRTNLFIVYNSVDNALVEPFSGQSPRPEYLGNRADRTPLEPSA